MVDHRNLFIENISCHLMETASATLGQKKPTLCDDLKAAFDKHRQLLQQHN